MFGAACGPNDVLAVGLNVATVAWLAHGGNNAVVDFDPRPNN